eukprot:9468762-Pyramimonas_sp.AAC.1
MATIGVDMATPGVDMVLQKGGGIAAPRVSQGGRTRKTEVGTGGVCGFVFFVFFVFLFRTAPPPPRAPSRCGARRACAPPAPRAPLLAFPPSRAPLPPPSPRAPCAPREGQRSANNEQYQHYFSTPFDGSSCANNGEGALTTPDNTNRMNRPNGTRRRSHKRRSKRR